MLARMEKSDPDATVDRQSESSEEEIVNSKHTHQVLTQLLAEANSLKDKGNSLYTSREYDAAEAFYTRGLDIITNQVIPCCRQGVTTSSSLKDDESIQRLFTTLSEQTKRIYVSLISNLILTKIGLKKPKEADTLACLFLDNQASFKTTTWSGGSTPFNTPTTEDDTLGHDSLLDYCRNFPKLWYRRAQAREELNLFQEAEADYSKCLSLLQDGSVSANRNLVDGFSSSSNARHVLHLPDMNKYTREIKDVMLALKKVRVEIKNTHTNRSAGTVAPVENHMKTITAPTQVSTRLDERDLSKRGVDMTLGDDHVVPSRMEIPRETSNQSYHKRTHESPEIIPLPKKSSQSSCPRPRPSADSQRTIILQLLAQTHNVHHLHALRPQDVTDFYGGTTLTSTGMENEFHSSIPQRRSVQPGEAYFFINYDWWKRWCKKINLFFDKEYNAILQLISEAASVGTTSEQSLRKLRDEKEFLDRKRMDILCLLPPGSFIPTVQQDGTLTNVKRRSNSISSESSSTESSESSYFGNDDTSQGDQFPCIDNSGLLLYNKDIQMIGSNAPNLKDNISSPKELLYWDWRHGSRITHDTVSPRPFLRPHLVRGYHYEILNREVYAALVSWYGEMTPSVYRRMSENKESGSPQLILYPEVRHENTNVDHETKQRFRCAACGSTRALFRCRNCNSVHYCDQNCQGSHWLYHKDDCKKLENRRLNDRYKNECHSNGYSNSTDYPSSSLGFLALDPRQGKMGLNNLGNTCFMNAALQCLSHTTPLTRYFLSDRFKADINTKNALGAGGKLAYAYEHLIKELWMGSGRSSTSPTKLKRAIALFAPQFAGSAQHDSQEFLAFLLDGLHEDLNLVRNPPYVPIPDFTIDKDLNIASAEAWDAYTRRNDSLVLDSFYGQFKSTCICPQCNKASVSFDAFNHVSLDIPQDADKEISLILFRTQTSVATYPTRYSIQVPRSSCWRDLKEVLSNLSGVPHTRLSVCDVYDNEIYEIFDDKNNNTNVQPSDTIVAFEIDPYDKATIHAISTHVRISVDKNKHGTGMTRKVPFGYPLLTSFGAHMTCHDVWEHIWNQVSYLFVDMQMEDARALLQIRLVRKDGSPLDIFPHNLSSNVIIDSNDIRCTSSTLPRYSKDQLSTYLGPGCTERFLFLHLEWIDEHRSDDMLSHERFLRTREHSSALGRKKYLKECVTLERCFEKFTHTERLDQYNQWYCSVCKEHVRAMKTIELWKIPNVLIVHFKRFEFMHAFRREKIETLVEFPLENLDMSRFCGSMRADRNKDAFADNKVPAIYDLFGVVNHYGRMGFGHYTATCRPFCESYIERDWFSFDDSLVQEIPQTSIVSSSAYVLFYRRRIFA